MIKRRIEKYSPTIFEEEAIDRGQLAFAPRFMVNASLPKYLTENSEHCRIINNHTYRYVCPSNIGLPGGIYSRFIFIWIVTKARQTKSRDLYLGKSLRAFMLSVLSLDQRGGDKGNITVFKEHFIRCINCVVYQNGRLGNTETFSITPIVEVAAVTDIDSWRWHATIRLSDPFYKEAMRSPPADLGALLILVPGTLKIDILNFLVARLYSLKKITTIPWSQLYAMHASEGVKRNAFKQRYKKAFQEAIVFYPLANVKIVNDGLKLSPSPKLIRSKT